MLRLEKVAWPFWAVTVVVPPGLTPVGPLARTTERGPLKAVSTMPSISTAAASVKVGSGTDGGGGWRGQHD